MFSFTAPYVLYLLLLIPAGYYVVISLRHRKEELPYPFIIPDKKSSFSAIRIVRILVLFCNVSTFLSMLALLIAMSGPVYTSRRDVIFSRGADILFVLDTSPSMAALAGNRISRFDMAREMIVDFIDNRKGDPVGLVIFGTDAILVSPPTLDYSTLKERLMDIRLMELGDGTAVGMGLGTASLHLRETGGDGKAVILLTDGSNNSGEVHPETAALLLKELGIRLYVVSLGGETSEVVEVIDPETGRVIRGHLKEEFNNETLKKITDVANGTFYEAPSPLTLKKIFLDISGKESTKKITGEEVRITHLHQRFIFFALLFALIAFFVRRLLLLEVQ